MNRRHRIGVFDSGIGGLDLLERLRSLLPGERFYYFSDTVNNPYGERSPEEIERFLADIVEGMLLRRVKLILVACNTASAVMNGLGEDHPLRVRLRREGVDVIGMTSGEAVRDLRVLHPRRVAVLATRLTAESGVYGRLIRERIPEAEVREVAAPEMVEAVENGYGRERTLATVRRALSPLSDFPMDALVLGCTHFPHIREAIREAVGPSVHIHNPAVSIADFVKAYLNVRGLLCDPGEDVPRERESVLFTNGDADTARKRLATLGLGGRFAVRQVDIRSDLSGKAVDVVGYGLTGKSLVAHLAERRLSRLTVRDHQDGMKEKLFRDFPGLKADTVTGDGYLNGLERSDVVFRSPGIPPNLEAFRRARAQGVPVQTDIDLFLREAKGRKVAVTGTNGKTTTTMLVHRLFDRATNGKSRLVGNVGRPVLEEMNALEPDSVSALELSSFQLEELDALPVEAAILLNITPDHLDRHGDMNGYIRAKGRIFTLLEPDAYAIYNIDDEHIVNGLLPLGCRAVMAPFSRTHGLLNGAFPEGNDLVFRMAGREELRVPNFLPARRFVGEHNLENLLASSLAAYLLDVPREIILENLLAFRGVTYRIEHFHTLSDVEYYDDSKGTNPDATLKALSAMRRPVRLLAGGTNKGTSFDDIAVACSGGRVKKAYLFGQMAESFAKSLRGRRSPPDFEILGGLEEAAGQAASEARPGECVLFSPASASPAGEKYYQRGDRFKAVIRALGTDERTDRTEFLPDPLAVKH